MAEKDNLQAVLAQNEKEALQALCRPYGQSSVQLQLFEEWAEQTAQAKTQPKNTYGLTLAEETYCRLRASGYNRTDAWRKAHPKSHASEKTVWPKASRLDKKDKVQARIAYWKEKLLGEALMSTTELFARLTEMARAGGKDAKGALELIGKIHGVFKAEKDLPGSAGNPLRVECIDFAVRRTEPGGATEGDSK
ncbi:hypothetical protein [Candidatus Avelusimicrobium facis]|uniref:hypothetical protein n=1 Tax=Candidatus Avelusimicrobium facis TaxID=3416203 RepID=UPI0015B610F2|nr:MAG TPA: Terminase small subunit [Caudoviricetes sp.]